MRVNPTNVFKYAYTLIQGSNGSQVQPDRFPYFSPNVLHVSASEYCHLGQADQVFVIQREMVDSYSAESLQALN